MVDTPLFMRDVAVDGLSNYVTNNDWFRFDQSDVTRFRGEIQNITGTLTEYYHNHRALDNGRRILYEFLDYDKDDDDDDDGVVEVSTEVKVKDRTASSDKSTNWVWEEKSSNCSDESLVSNYHPDSDNSYDSDSSGENDLYADTTGN